LKHLLAKWTHLIMAILGPLGAWGVLGFAAVDAALLGMPLDAIVGGYAYAHPNKLVLYAFMAAVGSALGSIVVYAIGYKTGEVLLANRIGTVRFNKIKASFDRHEFLALMLPSMLPPPTPFKLFVLSAGVAEMSLSRFLLAIFLGRFLRFTIECFLIVRYGPEVMAFIGGAFRNHLHLVIAIAAAAILISWWVWRLRKVRARRALQSMPTDVSSPAREV
jgi:membrane protein YqaA with SNARE-associated domain